MRFLITAFLVFSTATLVAGLDTPRINWQAKLNSPKGVALTGTHTLFFRIFESGDANTTGSGILKFSESANVTLTDSVANYAIGSVNPLTASLLSTATPTFLEISVDTVGNVVMPRTRLEHVPFAIHSQETDNAIRKTTSAHFAVDVTTSALVNGANLMSTYLAASFSVPNGVSLSATNRAVVFVPPGRYDLGSSQLVMTTDFVDLIGLSTARDDQFIFGTSNGDGTGVLRQTATDVRIENLLFQCTRLAGGLTDANSPAAYYPDSGSTSTRVTNCEFRDDGNFHSRSMRQGITYAGAYTNCTAGISSFGGLVGIASGVFTNCVGSDNAFGSNAGAIASGTFVDCVGASSSFGGNGGSASGTFVRCTAGGVSFGGTSGAVASATGTFTDCISTGNNSFGAGSSAVTTGAKFFRCRSLGGVWTGTFNGRMEDCTWAGGMVCGASARIYSSTFQGTLNLNSTAAGVTMTRAQSITNEASNLFGSTSAAALNLENAGVND